jgi:hypothetical protein
VTKPILKNATVIIVDDPAIGGQGLLAINKERALFVAHPGSAVITIELPTLKLHLETNRIAYGQVADAGLAALDEIEREAS